MNPPENALVLCVDEKSQVQALNRTQPMLPPGPGVPAVTYSMPAHSRDYPSRSMWKSLSQSGPPS